MAYMSQKINQLAIHWLVAKTKVHTFLKLKVSLTTAAVFDFA